MNHNTYIAVLVLVIALPGSSLASLVVKNVDPDTVTTSSSTTPLDKETDKTNSIFTADRGQLLYENHCTQCHDSAAHIRQPGKIRSIDDIRQWVLRWSNNLGLSWDNNDVELVADFLNQRFYHFIIE